MLYNNREGRGGYKKIIKKERKIKKERRRKKYKKKI